MKTSDGPLTVSQFLEAINGLLETQAVWVEGEVSEYRVSQGRWVHFDLKDAGAVVHCFGLTFRIRTPLEDGMTVRVWGVPRVYPRYGKFSLVVDVVTPSGEGALRRAFELLKERLAREGLFDVERKRSLARIPERIALITSPEAAAYSDFVKVLGARRGGVHILVVPVSVQGDQAVDGLVRALDRLSEEYPDLDAAVLIRGGGSLADLHAFNEERVVRALARSRVPTVVGVGHERDLTLADLVADVRASTPSNAAEVLTPTRAELGQFLRDLRRRLVRTVADHVNTRSTAVDDSVAVLRTRVRASTDRCAVLSRRMAGVNTLLLRSVHAFLMTVQQVTSRLRSPVGEKCRTRELHVQALARLLSGLHPERVLARGYSVTRRADTGVIVRSATSLRRDDQIRTTVQHGSLASTVTETEP